MSEDKPLSFEQCLERLEAVIKEIENGNLDLDTAIARFTEGMELVKQCRMLLSGAEQKLSLLLESDSEKPLKTNINFDKEPNNGL
ncbi:MAG: exodeoxyribonuclease VII small subunit [Bacillota bacterium]